MDDSEELRKPRVQSLIVDLFHNLYYHSPGTWPSNTFLGNSTDPRTVEAARAVLPPGRGMVVLDSDHRQQHVLDELRIYREFVAPGQYLVAEDTNINGRPVFEGYGPGPFEAVRQFLGEDPEFVRDDDLWKRQFFSFHQYGWLKRIVP